MTRLERGWRWARRHPARAGFVGVLGLSLLLLVGVGVAWAYQEELAAANTALESTNRELSRTNNDLSQSLDREKI